MEPTGFLKPETADETPPRKYELPEEGAEGGGKTRIAMGMLFTGLFVVLKDALFGGGRSDAREGKAGAAPTAPMDDERGPVKAPTKAPNVDLLTATALADGVTEGRGRSHGQQTWDDAARRPGSGEHSAIAPLATGHPRALGDGELEPTPASHGPERIAPGQLSQAHSDNGGGGHANAPAGGPVVVSFPRGVPGPRGVAHASGPEPGGRTGHGEDGPGHPHAPGDASAAPETPQDTASDTPEASVPEGDVPPPGEQPRATPSRRNLAPVVTRPVILDDLLVNQTIVIALADLLQHAYDPDGDALTVQDLSASSGTLTSNGDGTWTFTPDLDDDQDVVFTYAVSDGIAAVPQTALLDLLPSFSTPADGARDGDIIFGTPHGDTISGGSSSDEIYGGDGNDIIFGGGGNDEIYGGDGDDMIFGGGGDDEIYGGGGDDIIVGGGGNDEIHGGDGDDTIFAGRGDDRVFGDDGNDTIVAGDGNDTAIGGGGNDIFVATANDGDDVYIGGDGSDTIDLSGIGTDMVVDLSAGTVQAAPGEDVADAAPADGADSGAGNAAATPQTNDVQSGDAASDPVVVATDDSQDASGGNATATPQTNDAQSGDAANDPVVAATDDSQDASGGNATATPQTNDAQSGDAANDPVAAATDDGQDGYLGAAEADTVDLSTADEDVKVDLSKGMVKESHSGVDQIEGIENAIGGSEDDKFIANAETNVLTGGAGDDAFVFKTIEDAGTPEAPDVITDFQPGDKIDLKDIDADWMDGGNQDFELVLDKQAFTEAGQLKLRYEHFDEQDHTIIEGNVDNDTHADFAIDVIGHHNLTKDDFEGVN